MVNLSNITFGAELEIPDWNIPKYEAELLKTGATRDLLDYTIINSSGVANDPKLNFCIFGGEINTKPTATIAEQVKHIGDILNAIGPHSSNHSQNLHLHIRIPELKGSIEHLKKFTSWLYLNQEAFCNRFILPEIERQSNFLEIFNPEDNALRRQFYQRRKQSRMRKIYPYEFQQTSAGTDFESWYNGWFAKNKTTGKRINHTIHRQYINLTSLHSNNTIEFRFFSHEDNLTKIENAFNLCLTTIEAILNNTPAYEIPDFDLPQGGLFNPKLEKIAKLTKQKNGCTQKDKEIIEHNLKVLIRDGIISQEDLGVELSGEIPTGDLLTKPKPTPCGTRKALDKSNEKKAERGDISLPEIW